MYPIFQWISVNWIKMRAYHDSNTGNGHQVACAILYICFLEFDWEWLIIGFVGCCQMCAFLIPVWISYHTPNNVWDEITYPFPNFNGYRWILGIAKWFHLTLYYGCNYLFVLILKLIHIVKDALHANHHHKLTMWCVLLAAIIGTTILATYNFTEVTVTH